MEERQNLQEELRKIAPFLSKMKKESDGFTVPDNYFKKLPDEIINQLNVDNQEVALSRGNEKNWWKDFLNNLNWLLQPRPAMAFASILLLIFAGLFLMNPTTEPEKSIALSDISLEELEIFFEENMEDYATETLVEGNEQLMEKGFGDGDDLDEYFEEMIEEADLEDLL